MNKVSLSFTTNERLEKGLLADYELPVKPGNLLRQEIRAHQNRH